jgi:hypothetical protein
MTSKLWIEGASPEGIPIWTFYRFTDSDYTFGIFKLFLSTIVITPQSIWFEPAYMYYIMYGEYLHLSRICITFIPDNITMVLKQSLKIPKV